jgi:hypothetical protein
MLSVSLFYVLSSFFWTLYVEQHGITKGVPICKLPENNEVLYGKNLN